METLRTGDLAFFDSMRGLIPCRVESIAGASGPASSAQTVRIVVTKDCGAWKRGEHWTASGLWVVPRKSVRKPQGSAFLRIRRYSVECDAEAAP
jgi:hypothetical protein